MIRIGRNIAPKILEFGLNLKSEGERETLDAISFFADNNNLTEPYKKTGERGRRTKASYSVYKDSEIRKQLLKLFNGKCAYCESKISSIYSGDIEHFRPKGRIQVNGNLKRPGYYWLASEWENLLFACPFCNQTYTHEITDNGTLKEVVLGKLDQFPLFSENYRLNAGHGQIYFTNEQEYHEAFKNEERERLLLKPCTDSVEKFFKYELDGRILPADGLTDFERQQAETSITVYALERLGLVQARAAKIVEIKAQIRRVEEAIENLNRLDDNSINSERVWFEGILRREMKILKEFKKPEKEYSGLAKFIIDNYFDKL